MTLTLSLTDDRAFEVQFSTDNYSTDDLNTLYTQAKQIKEQDDSALLDIRADKGNGLILLVNPAKLAFTLGTLLKESASLT